MDGNGNGKGLEMELLTCKDMAYPRTKRWRVTFRIPCGIPNTSRNRSRRLYRILFLAVCFIVGGFCLALLVTNSYNHENFVVIDLSENYFQTQDDFFNGTFIVDNQKCRIPDVDIWNCGIRRLAKHHIPKDTCRERGSITYVEHDTVVINQTAAKEQGLELKDLVCCYRTVLRGKESQGWVTPRSYSNGDYIPDNEFRLSDTCYKMGIVTKPVYGFIKVTCTSWKGWLNSLHKSRLSYTQFHLVATFSGSPNISRKISYWEKCLKTPNCRRQTPSGLPPNVLILGVDSTSRLNFRRFMHRSLKVLEKTVDAEEMKGYTKVGVNTFPNFVPLMSSLSVEELKSSCMASNSDPQDNCSYIWKNFSQQNYLTSHLEDSPRMAIFNYLKTGFIRPPVDFYTRPLMLAAYDNEGGSIMNRLLEGLPFTVKCVGYQRPEEMLLNYIVDLAELAHSKKIPFFIGSWLTDLTHDDSSNLQTMDEVFANTLLKLYEKGLLENTVLYVMSDHGYRFTDIRTTLSGWYEDKMPMLWMKLPQSVAKDHGSWVEALKHNSRQLMTPFDVHESFKNILRVYSPNYVEETIRNQSKYPLRGLSPFEKLPHRTCEETEIPRFYCPCHAPVEYNANMTFLRLAAESIVNKINTLTPLSCSRLRLASVSASAMLTKPSSIEKTGNGMFPQTVIVAITTVPGYFHFESWVDYDPKVRSFAIVSYVQRTNRVNSSTACLGEYASAEEYCYCEKWM